MFAAQGLSRRFSDAPQPAMSVVSNNYCTSNRGSSVTETTLRELQRSLQSLVGSACRGLPSWGDKVGSTLSEMSHPKRFFVPADSSRLGAGREQACLVVWGCVNRGRLRLFPIVFTVVKRYCGLSVLLNACFGVGPNVERRSVFTGSAVYCGKGQTLGANGAEMREASSRETSWTLIQLHHTVVWHNTTLHLSAPEPPSSSTSSDGESSAPDH